MQIEHLETFLDLMETNSFNRTAERLNLTQSTVSGRIQALDILAKAEFHTERLGHLGQLGGEHLAVASLVVG